MRSVYVLIPLTDQVKAWIEDHVSYELTWGKGIVVEHHFIGDIYGALLNEGFKFGEDFEIN